MKQQWNSNSILKTLLILAEFMSASGLGCYRCHSLNNSDISCHDPYHPMYGKYLPKCFTEVKDRKGLFPAHFCIKINGVSRDGNGHKEELYVRDCAVENIGSMCGQFIFANRHWTGCVQTCRLDGCNTANKLTEQTLQNYILLTASAVFLLYK